MTRAARGTIAAATGLFFAALTASAQRYTISAKPGVVNYIEGVAYLNGAKLSEEAVRATFLAAGDRLTTGAGKVEVLLTPGVFLRIGDDSEIHMISPTLTNTQVEIVRGEAILEAAGLVQDNNIQITDHGAVVTVEKNGLYRFKADNPPSAAVLEGKALVYFGDSKLQLDKDHETILGPVLKAQKFDPKQEDELYAWSNVRSEYEAAGSYQSAKDASLGNYGGGWYDFGYSGFYGPGWLWNSAFNSWCWLPAYGAFYSPFGWGFYSPGAVGYAPVVTVPVYRGGHWNGVPNPNWKNHPHWSGASTTATVAIRTDHPPAVGVVAGSPWAAHEARVQAERSLAASGTFHPASGGSQAFLASTHVSAPAVSVRGGGWSGGGGAAARAGGGGGGGWSGGGGHASAGGFSGGGGGGHAGGGGGGGGGGHR